MGCAALILFLVNLAYLFTSSEAVLNLPADAFSSDSIGIYKSFLKSAVTGAISTSITLSIVTPIDALRHKVRTDFSLTGKPFHQVVFSIFGRNRDRFWPLRIQDRNILRGLGVATLGYSVRGFFRFGLYDAIKESLNSAFRDDEIVSRTSLPILILSAGFAEILTTCVTCPFESTRLAILKNPKLNQGMRKAMHGIVRSEGVFGLFKGYNKAIFRQVPYSCARIASYDVLMSSLRQAVGFNETYPETNKNVKYLSSAEKIQLMSGLSAGAIAAVVSKHAQGVLSTAKIGPLRMGQRLVTLSPSSVAGAFEGFAMSRNYRSHGLTLGSLAALRFILCEQELIYLKCASLIDKLL